MEAIAKLKNVPMSARKMRLVVNNIRGLDIDNALNTLRFTRKEASIWLEKLLLSAIANWEQKAGPGEDAGEYELYIKEAYVNQGSMLKRFRPAPYGRAHRIRKHTCHVFLMLENRVYLDSELEEEELEELLEGDEVLEEIEEGDEYIEEIEEVVEEADKNDKGDEKDVVDKKNEDKKK